LRGHELAGVAADSETAMAPFGLLREKEQAVAPLRHILVMSALGVQQKNFSPVC
jgi:hypothetical protein